LLQQKKTTVKDILEITSKLKAYPWYVGLITASISLWEKGFYFQFMKWFFIASNDYTASKHKKTSLLQTRLSDNYINVSSTVTSVIFFLARLYVSKRWGGGVFNFLMLQVMPHLIFSDLDRLVRGIDACGISRSKFIKNRPALRWMLGLCLISLRPVFAGGVRRLESLVYFTGGYFLATLCCYMMGALLGKLRKDPSLFVSKLKPAGYFLLNAIVIGITFIGSLCLWKIFYPSMIRPYIFAPPDDLTLINHPNLYLQYCDRSKRVAGLILGISPDAKKSIILKRYRELAFEYHPDLNGGATNRKMSELNNAKKILFSC